MRNVTYSMGVSLDGFIVDANGSFDWSDPDEATFRLAMDELRGVGVHLMGRRLYETMLYWDGIEDDPDQDDLSREWAAMWNALPKVVFSSTLTEVRGANTRLASGSVADEIARLRAEPGEGEIALGGATLAAAVPELIDEYRIRINPVLVGGGTPYFPMLPRRVPLELVENRTFDRGVLYLRYRVKGASRAR